MSDRVPRLARWILALAGAVVPGERRTAWRRQWVAELEHRCAPGGRSEGLLAFAWGSMAHAVFLRREGMRMTGWTADLRHATRALLARPGFSLLTVATLAVGIGAATAIFSLAETLLLRDLPVEGGDRLVRVYSTKPGFGWFSVSYRDYRDFTARDDLFEGASFYVEQSRDVSGGGDPERVRIASVHEAYFQTLRSPTLLGRVFDAGDHDPRTEATAVLRASFWERRFGADSTVIGRSIRLDGVPHTVIGVVEDRFAWPAGVQAWTPLQWGGTVPESADSRTNHTWQVVGRLQPGVRVADVHDQVARMAAGIYARPEVDARDRGTTAVVVPLGGSAGGEGRTALFLTLGAAVFFVLLIACMNASGMLLTRAWSRARELSLRSALGAARPRLVGILLGESAVLAAVGGAVGLGIGQVALRRAFAMAPPDVTSVGDLRLNGAVVAAGIGISALAALMAGLLPALRATRGAVADVLRDGTSQAGHSWKTTRLRRGFVVTQLALSLALLVGSGLTIRGFQKQLAADPGFDPTGLLSFGIRLPAARYGEDVLVDGYLSEAVNRLERLPGVVRATTTSLLPLGGGGMSLGRALVFDGATPPPEGVEYFASWVEVDPGYFDALDVPLVEGRGFTADDRADAPLVAMVNERLARQMSPNEPIVGRVVRSFYDENLPRTVVGVTPDLQFNGVSRDEKRPLVFVPRVQSARASMAFLVRTAGDPREMIPMVRETMAGLDADVALDQLQPLREAHAADLAGIRFLTTLFGAFGILALGLAVTGVYGLVSFSVSQRRQEIGVRMAMGATASAVRASVMRESAWLAGAGLTIGLALAYLAGRVLAAGMSGIAVMEPSTYLAVCALLGAAVLAASWVPARRATRVDPVDALRSD